MSNTHFTFYSVLGHTQRTVSDTQEVCIWCEFWALVSQGQHQPQPHKPSNDKAVDTQLKQGPPGLARANAHLRTPRPSWTISTHSEYHSWMLLLIQNNLSDNGDNAHILHLVPKFSSTK